MNKLLTALSLIISIYAFSQGGHQIYYTKDGKTGLVSTFAFGTPTIDNLLVTDSTGTSISICYSINGPYDSVVIYRGLFNGTFSRLAQTTSTNYTNTNLTYNTGYKYRIRAYKNGSASSYSISDSATTWTWPYSMMYDYTTNRANRGIWTQAEKDTLVNIFTKNVYIDTAFRQHRSKQVADFIVFFTTSQKTSPLTTKTNTKTGATLRWFKDYVYANSVSQNNEPTFTASLGWFIATSTDGLKNWTAVSIGSSVDLITSIIPSPNMFSNSLTAFTFPSISARMNIDNLVWPSTVTSIQILGTLVGDGSTITWPSSLISLTFKGDWYLNNFSPSSTTTTYIFGGSGDPIVIHGIFPDLPSTRTTGSLNISVTTCNTTGSNLTNFTTGMTAIRFDNNYWSTYECNKLIHSLKVWFVDGSRIPTQNAQVNLSGTHMGSMTNTSDATALTNWWTTNSKTLTLTYNP